MAKVHPKFDFSILDAIVFLLGVIRFTIHHDIVSFPTAHGFCESCLAKVKRNQRYSGMVWFASLLMLFFCIGGTLISGAAAVMMWSDPIDRNLWLKIVFGGVIGIVFATFGQIFARRLRVPASMRYIGRRPFYLVGIDDADSHTN
jgi:hypothetical protein